jgi:D-glycero-D-manno-heptose 1,7-bisphosphate phosphatase
MRSASRRTGELTVPVLYLDLDGTVRQGKDDALGRFVNGPEDVVVFPEAVALMMREWKHERQGRIIGVSNQGGVALGIVSMADVTAAMVETQRQTGGLFDKIHYCTHHPKADDPEMAYCWCRKPSPGGLVEAALNLSAFYDEIYPPHMGLFVGDRAEDRDCARLASIPFMWAADWRATA